MPQRLDFKQIAASIDIFDVARYLKLAVNKNRATCLACESERALEFYPETNTFYCHSAKVGADCISLLAHVRNQQGQYAAAKELSEQFQTANAAGRSTDPQKPEVLASASTAAVGAPKKGHPPFDPEEYASKLAFTPEIEALGITEVDAARLGIGFANTGFHRGSIVIAIRNPDGTIAGFAGIKGEVKLPSKWLAVKVVEFKKRA